MNYGYIRVSTDRQTLENQRFEICQFCTHEGITIDGWIEETVSGAHSYHKRRLGHLLRRANKGDLIICSELSRLGRNLFMVMEILSQCMERGCRVWTIKDGYRLGDDLQSKVLAFAFALSAEIERNLISQRTREALARIQSEGKPVGRPRGRLTSRESHPLYRYDTFIRRSIAQGMPRRELARRLRCNRNTLRQYITKWLEDVEY